MIDDNDKLVIRALILEEAKETRSYFDTQLKIFRQDFSDLISEKIKSAFKELKGEINTEIQSNQRVRNYKNYFFTLLGTFVLVLVGVAAIIFK